MKSYINQKSNFYKDEKVIEFINWFVPKIDSGFTHQYINQRNKKEWQCNSIYNAYENYAWDFRVKDLEGKTIKGSSFEESSNILDKLSCRLKKSLETKDDILCKDTCLKILEWGGVLRGNKEKIEKIDEEQGLVQYLESVKMILTSEKIEVPESDDQVVYMNSGFTKIYSLYINDFVIYDSRVGAALGLLVKRFCDDRHLEDVPKNLKFAYANGRGKANRNPDPVEGRFPLLRNTERYGNHLENNLRANWLLKEILSHSSNFSNLLPPEKQLRALEAALFMIGYQVSLKEYKSQCNVLYDPSMMQCCGNPIQVGQYSTITGNKTEPYMFANHNISFEEEHHLDKSAKLKGLVSKITTVFVEKFANNDTEEQRLDNPNNVFVQYEVSYIDGYEHVNYGIYKTSDASFYIITLKNVIIEQAIDEMD